MVVVGGAARRGIRAKYTCWAHAPTTKTLRWFVQLHAGWAALAQHLNGALEVHVDGHQVLHAGLAKGGAALEAFQVFAICLNTSEPRRRFTAECAAAPCVN